MVLNFIRDICEVLDNVTVEK